MSAPLRLVTYLAPGLPLALFEGVASHLARSLRCETRLFSDASRSAPEPGPGDPFGAAEADVGFLCAPGYLWLSEPGLATVELVPAAFVFDDARNADRPVYFADLVVRTDSRARSLEELAGARWGYNDPCSLSGYFSVLAELERRGLGPAHFSATRALGSHHAALAALAAGEIDCAAIDSNTLLLERRAGRATHVRAVESYGPFPVQPIVVRSALDPARRSALASALLAMHEHEEGRRALAAAGVRRFAPVSPADYEPERRWLGRSDGSSTGCVRLPR